MAAELTALSKTPGAGRIETFAWPRVLGGWATARQRRRHAVPAACGAMHQLTALAIDDIGTGHASLVQSRGIPFTRLKVDRGFVHGASHNEIIRPMLEASISLAHRLGMQVVAEGVESEEDLALLRALGCDAAQGFLLGRPTAAVDMPASLHSQLAAQTDWGTV